MSQKILFCALVAAACSSGSAPPAHPARPSTPACQPQHLGTEPHPAVRNAVVRVVTDSGSGSGFILSGGEDKRLIVTNYHVIEGASAVMVQLEIASASQIVAQVVKVDKKNDLALLEVSSQLLRAHGLYLSEQPVTLGQSHAVLGYPAVVGFDSQLTYELGSVAASARHLGERELIQTNSNINPGNSGGPAVDGCGTVIGVATLKHLKAERVGLLVPATDVRALLAAYQTPQPAAAEAVTRVVTELFSSVAYRRSAEAAELFSREYLDGQVLPRVALRSNMAEASLKQLNEQLKKKGSELSSLSVEEQANLMKDVLSREELLALHVKNHLETGDIGKYAALREFHVGVVSDDFGDIRDHKVDRLIANGNDSAECDVQVVTGNGVARYRFRLAREWGDWAIREAHRVR